MILLETARTPVEPTVIPGSAGWSSGEALLHLYKWPVGIMIVLALGYALVSWVDRKR